VRITQSGAFFVLRTLKFTEWDICRDGGVILSKAFDTPTDGYVGSLLVFKYQKDDGSWEECLVAAVEAKLQILKMRFSSYFRSQLHFFFYDDFTDKMHTSWSLRIATDSPAQSPP
jgi:hypothetical protein